MNKNYFPPGWDEARVQRVIDHYENMSDDEMVAEDEAARLAGENQLMVLKDNAKTNGMPVAKGTRRRTKAK
jgi:hypothetical protein